MAIYSRREVLVRSLSGAAGLFAATGLTSCCCMPVCTCGKRGSRMRFGLVTYLWGKDWDLSTLISNCESTRVLGVELRTEHAHGVEADLSSQHRKDVKTRFGDSPVTLVGLGTNFAFHYADAARLRSEIDGAKQYVVLSHDVGGSGIKVKPNNLPDGVPVEKTVEQIGQSLNELGQFAADYGQEVRVEVHGKKTCKLPVMKKIFDVVDQPNVGVCWNSNEQDLESPGLEYNFNLMKDRFGKTVHVRELNVGPYPYRELFNLFVRVNYDGWILLEARTKPDDRVKALAEQRVLFEQMVAKTQARA